MRGTAKLAAIQARPLNRLQKPMVIVVPNNFPALPLRQKSFHRVSPIGKPMHELVYDPINRLRPRTPQFAADFEGGNLGQVFLVGTREYEIHLLPDPSPHYSALWYFFRVEQIPRGDYHFTITGFFRDAPLHQIGVQPVALSMNGTRDGIGWQRFGDQINFWQSSHKPLWSLSFSFNVGDTDTMYFAYVYPYTYSELRAWISRQPAPFLACPVTRSHGGVDVPIIFWDADLQTFLGLSAIRNQPKGLRDYCKPLIVVAARHHPGEPVASYAMEAFMDGLFGETVAGKRLLLNFSFLLIPMVNVDGVICGYYRPSLTGYDMNRSWILPQKKKNPVEFAIIQILDRLVKSRPLLFLLDFHGHSAQCNAFTYGVDNPDVAYNHLQGLFPRQMSKVTSIFDERGGAMLEPDAYSTTMRVALHHRYQIPFAYTLEMSFGGLDIGPRCYTQLTPESYREVGAATVSAIAAMLLEQIPLNSIIGSYVPPVFRILRDTGD
jgi:hypothetical protein